MRVRMSLQMVCIWPPSTVELLSPWGRLPFYTTLAL
uniref:Uncharacterized protein n=1 Tax=Siphoviridae sp. ct6YY1 TaxID=2825343 RepID=A0A8S5V333_9CAUD|nr:MAG TPA: hypothetical protein [Siphoviridae sp. ct6YY1]DAQ55637.1 MAG TPA: hypothetical protein [Caudoviricetes sp.]